MIRYELHAPSTDPDVPGATLAFSRSRSGAAKWCHDTVGATATDRVTGATLDATTLPAPASRFMPTQEASA